MKIVFLGTNGWYTNQNGNTPCVLIDSKDHYVVFDAGNGIYKLDKYITQNKPISLFISHFHLDHVSGVHTMPKFSFPQGIDVYIAKGRKKDFEILANPPYTIGYKPQLQNIKNLKTEIRLHELKEGSHKIPFAAAIIEQFHAYKDHGYRVTLEGKTIAYSGDCGKTEKSIMLARNADLLIHECSNTEPDVPDIWGHTDATQAAQIARDANAKRLILTHFGPRPYKTLADRKKAEVKARKIFKNTICAVDDMAVSV